ncbi:MBL fold metallo-hydrolase [Sphingomonas sp. 1P06PA]|uniref:MBL fold metallo-hydrolase n=1 Tax=Sphingomonas sp. 1P06PA TaxID=554121 RepID=UPI0039A781F2
MLVRFWGTRGSLPVAPTPDIIAGKIGHALVAANGLSFTDPGQAARWAADALPFTVAGTYGGATACVELDGFADSFFVCDLGSGVRGFGLSAMARAAGGRPRVYNIFLSHLHWDHIMGFPFFVPAFDPDALIRIHAGHPEAEAALRRQQEEISFPVSFDWLRARIEFVTLTPGVPHEVDGVTVHIIRQYHSNDSYGFRFEARGRSVVYSTDSEHKPENMESELAFESFFRDADLVVFDTMYSLADSVTMKEDWGHSSALVAVDLCQNAGVHRLAMFHHEPIYGDEEIAKLHREAVRYEELNRDGHERALAVLCAHDGLEIRL